MVKKREPQPFDLRRVLLRAADLELSATLVKRGDRSLDELLDVVATCPAVGLTATSQRRR